MVCQEHNHVETELVTNPGGLVPKLAFFHPTTHIPEEQGWMPPEQNFWAEK
jgi:hypothetical protein